MDEVTTVADVSTSNQLASSPPPSIIPWNLPLLSSPLCIGRSISEALDYLASGVRPHAGHQAQLLNQIVCELPPEHPLSNARTTWSYSSSGRSVAGCCWWCLGMHSFLSHGKLSYEPSLLKWLGKQIEELSI